MTITDEMVERAMQAFYHDAPHVLQPIDADDRQNLAQWTADMRAALTAALNP